MSSKVKRRGQDAQARVIPKRRSSKLRPLNSPSYSNNDIQGSNENHNLAKSVQEKVPYQRQLRKSFVGIKSSNDRAGLRALRQLGLIIALTLALRSTVVVGYRRRAEKLKAAWHCLTLRRAVLHFS